MANQRSKSSESQANAYKVSKREETNRRNRLERELLRNPNNAEQLSLAIKNIRHRRATPVNPTWTATKRRTAELFKLFTGRFNADIFNNNEKISGPALMSPGPYSLLRNGPVAKDSMFSLGARVLGK